MVLLLCNNRSWLHLIYCWLYAVCALLIVVIVFHMSIPSLTSDLVMLMFRHATQLPPSSISSLLPSILLDWMACVVFL